MFFEETRKDKIVSLDIVIPIYNEEDVLSALFSRLDTVFSYENCNKYGISNITYLFIDDGSTDKSLYKIIEKFKHRPGVNTKIILLSRNFGQQSAIACGINNSHSDLTSIIDADLQDPPELIAEMINKWRQGYEVVYAQRENRKENIINRFFYWLFYRIYHFLSPIDIAMDSGDFCLLSKRVVDEFKKMPESIKFPRSLRSWIGFAQTGIVYDRPKRIAGRTKYTFRNYTSWLPTGLLLSVSGL